MRAPSQSRTEETKNPKRHFKNKEGWRHLSDRLLVAAVIVYAVGAFLFMATPAPAVLAWVVIGAVVGFVALASLIGASHSVGPKKTATRQQHTSSSDGWAEMWESLMEEEVR